MSRKILIFHHSFASISQLFNTKVVSTSIIIFKSFYDKKWWILDYKKLTCNVFYILFKRFIHLHYMFAKYSRNRQKCFSNSISKFLDIVKIFVQHWLLSTCCFETMVMLYFCNWKAGKLSKAFVYVTMYVKMSFTFQMTSALMSKACTSKYWMQHIKFFCISWW